MNQKFFFPLNYDYSNKLLGIIEYKLLLPLLSLASILIMILYKTNIDFFSKVGIFTLVFLPILLILNSQVYNEPFYHFVIAVIKHYVNRKDLLIQTGNLVWN